MVWDVLYANSPMLHIPGRFRPQLLCPDRFTNYRDSARRPWLHLTRQCLGGGETTQKLVPGTQDRQLPMFTTQSPGPSSEDI